MKPGARKLDLRITDSPDIYRRVDLLVKQYNRKHPAGRYTAQSVVRHALRFGLLALEKEAKS